MARVNLLNVIQDQIQDLALTRQGVMKGEIETARAQTVATVSNSFSRTIREYRDTDRYLTGKALAGAV